MSGSHAVDSGFMPSQGGLVVSVSASHAVDRGFIPRRDGLVVCVSVSHAVGSWPGRVIPNTIIKRIQTQAIGSAA